MATGSLEYPPVLLRVETRVGHHHDPAEPPTVEVLLDLLDDTLVRRVPRPHPGPHRYPRPGHREADHHLRQVGALVLAKAPLAKAFLALVLPLDLEEGARGVQEDEVDLQIEEVGHRGEDAELDLLRGLEQEVHGPVELV
ncbi:MAG: hypothetical protein AB1645_09760, partial [Bacillota bacterium]